MEKKNIYTKLMEVRVKFHGLELKKSGLNKFAGFKYYELGDFLVPATKLLQEARNIWINFDGIEADNKYKKLYNEYRNKDYFLSQLQVRLEDILKELEGYKCQ